MRDRKPTKKVSVGPGLAHLMASTRCGISAKQLERELGVSYRTAWRMLNKIRNELMRQDDEPLSGDVEADETLGGGRTRAGDSRRGRQFVDAKKSHRPTIFGAVERGGRVRLKVIPSRSSRDLEGVLFSYVLPESMIFTDEWYGYDPKRVGSRYIAHRRIKHEDRIYVDGEVHTQTIEGVFGLMKNSIRGTHHAVSSKWLPSYLGEFCFRYNRRNDPRGIFAGLMERATR